MLDVLNAIFLAGNLIAQNVNVVARADEDILVQQGVKVYAISMTEQAPAWTDKCKYDGVMVEYARDWPEEQSATGEVLPPEPDKPIGYALILTEERCPEKEARKIFNTDSKFFAPLFGKKFVIREGGPMDTRDYWNQREEHRAKWMPQVLRTIEAEAATNPVAKAFVEEMHARQALSEMAPKQSDQTTSSAPN